MAYQHEDFVDADLKRVEKILANAMAFLTVNEDRPTSSHCEDARREIGLALGYVSSVRMTLG